MANYKYIIVNKPDRGLMLNEQDANISDQHCSDCKNVYFRNGQIIKRFGYGARKIIQDPEGVPITSTIVEEVTHMKMHESNINVSTSTKRLYSFSLEDSFYYIPASGKWTIMTDKIVGEDLDGEGWDECSGVTALSVVVNSSTGPLGSCIVGSKCIKICAIPSFEGDMVFKRLSAQSYSAVSSVGFWMYVNDLWGNDGVRVVVYNDAEAARVESPVFIQSGGTYSTWQYHSGNFGGMLGNSFSAVTSRLIKIKMNNDSPLVFTRVGYIDALQFFRGNEATSLSAGSTKISPTLSDSVLANVSGSTQSYLMVTNYEQDHYVRYVDNGISNPLLKLLTGANDAGSGYNDPGSSDYHRCKAISGYKEKLHLLGGSEDTAGTGAVDKLLQDRWSATNDAEEWQSGVATARNVADTSGAILNAVRLTDDNNYIFKTDAIVRQSFLGGESAIFSYNTVFQEDALLAAKMVQVIGDYCYWVGRKNVYAFGSGTTMSPIGDAIESEFYSTDGIEYNDGEFHRRSFWLDMSIVNLVGIMVPASSNYPDKAFMFNPDEKVWAIWDFSDGTSSNITASDYAIGLVTEGTETNLEHSVHFGNSSGEFYEFDTSAKNDGSNAIDAYWISKAFSNPKSERAEITAWNGLDFEAKGDGITVSIKADDGDWQEIETKVLTSSYDWYTVGFHQQARFLKIRFANSTLSETFSVRSFTMRYEDGATH